MGLHFFFLRPSVNKNRNCDNIIVVRVLVTTTIDNNNNEIPSDNQYDSTDIICAPPHIYTRRSRTLVICSGKELREGKSDIGL